MTYQPINEFKTDSSLGWLLLADHVGFHNKLIILDNNAIVSFK